MAEIRALRALHYNLALTDGLQPVVAPPYDVIDSAQRATPRGPFAPTRRRHRPTRTRAQPGGEPHRARRRTVGASGRRTVPPHT